MPFEPTKAPDTCSRPKWGIFLTVLAAFIPWEFALVTDNVWEDFFITYRCSLNFVHGDGLVYEIGRRVHAFTSPLGTLIPAGLSWLLRTDDPLRVMDLFRLCSCAALAGAWALAVPRINGQVALAFTGGLWLLDAKLAAYSTNGMETAGLVFFVVLLWRALLDGAPRRTAVALAGLMWTRPDGFIFAGALMVGGLLLRAAPAWRPRTWLGVLVGGGLLYAPWFLWAWYYYGSPVPHTIQAKGDHVFTAESFSLLASYPWRLIFGRCVAHDAFLPPYFYLGGWPGWIWWWGKSCSLAAAGAAFWPRVTRPARLAGVAFLLGGFYLELTPRAPWYFPAWGVLAYLAVGGIMAAGAEMLEQRMPGWRTKLSLGAALTAMTLSGAAFWVAVSTQLREHQRLIEWGVRAPIGTELRQATGPRSATVFLEPLGYMGFFSNLSMRDTPGLCAPEVVALRRSGKKSMAQLALALQTDWVVLRYGEYAAFTRSEREWFGKSYRLWSRHDVRVQVAAVPWLPGRGFAEFDADFLVWRKRPPVMEN
jgi:hypothetical protein